MTDSCFITRLSHFLALSENERGFLARLEEHEREYARHDHIYRVGEQSKHLYLVQSGWLYSYADLPDGRRQILRIHHPGDIVGFPDIAFTETATNVRTSTRVTLCPFPKTALNEILEESPRLTALFFTLEMREQVLLADLLRSLGRMQARERVAHLLLDLRAKLRVANRDVGNRFSLHLTQGEIGDVLGLTNVHVSNTLTAMVNDGLLARNGEEITLLKEDELRRLADFEDRHAAIDTDWFPAPR